MICDRCLRDDRCAEMRGAMRCQEWAGHVGPHWVCVSSDGVVKWGMEMSGRCGKYGPCVLPTQHDGPCIDGYGSRARVEIEPIALEDAPW